MVKPEVTGPRAKEIRFALRLSQRQFADRLGVASVVTISRWEKAENFTHPSKLFQPKLQRAAKEVGVPLK